MELVTITSTAAAWLPAVIVAGLPETDGVPKVQPVGAVGRVGSDTVQLVPVSKGPTVVDAPPAMLTVTSPAPQLYLIAKVPLKPELFASKVLEIVR